MKSAFCMLVGELMYVAINTRPEMRRSKPSGYITKATRAHYEVLKLKKKLMVDFVLKFKVKTESD